MSQNTTIIDHPLIRHKLSKVRDKNTNTKDFRELISEIGGLMAYEITRNLETVPKMIETPIATAQVEVLAKDIVIVPILRAGLGMVDGITNLIPNAKVGHIGLYRDEETLEPHTYYAKFPKELSKATVLLVDPMLATGGSAVAALDMLKKRGVKNIHFMCIIAAPEGVKRLTEAHPDVDVYIGALDDHLNEHKYIVPGLGDAGDRIFGTK